MSVVLLFLLLSYEKFRSTNYVNSSQFFQPAVRRSGKIRTGGGDHWAPVQTRFQCQSGPHACVDALISCRFQTGHCPLTGHRGVHALWDPSLCFSSLLRILFCFYQPLAESSGVLAGAQTAFTAPLSSSSLSFSLSTPLICFQSHKWPFDFY